MTTIFLSYLWGPSCPGYGGVQSISLEKTSCMDHGSSSNSMKFCGSNHAGTHIDFPRHFVKEGQSLDSYRADDFIFNNVLVVDLHLDRLIIEPRDLIDVFKRNKSNGLIDLVLFRSGYGFKRDQSVYWEFGPGIGLGVADMIAEYFPNCRAIGLDWISLSSWQHRELGREVHREFLGRDHPIIIIEDMDLSSPFIHQIERVIALPLRIEDADGAPCTVIAELEIT